MNNFLVYVPNIARDVLKGNIARDILKGDGNAFILHFYLLNLESLNLVKTQTLNPWLRRHVASPLGHRPQLHQWDLDLMESLTEVYMPNALPVTSELFGGW